MHLHPHYNPWHPDRSDEFRSKPLVDSGAAEDGYISLRRIRLSLKGEGVIGRPLQAE